MSPRFLLPLCLVCATASFAGIRLLHQAPKPNAQDSPKSDAHNSSPKPTVNSQSHASQNNSPDPAPKPNERAPKSLKEITDAIVQKGESPADSRLALMETIGRLSPEQLAGILTAEADDPNFFRKMRLDFQFAARRLCELAPTKAADLWLKHPSLRYQSGAFLDPWIKKDPQAFVAWNASLPADVQKATASSFESLAKESPEQFAAIAALVANLPAGANGARSAVSSMFPKGEVPGDLDKSIQYATSLPEGALRNAALGQMAKWPGLDLNAHPEIAKAIAALPADDAAKLGRDLTKNPTQLPAGPARETAFSTVIGEQARKNPAGTAVKLDSLLGSPDYPAAVRGFVNATASKDPATAAEWALSIDANSPQQRMATLEKVATAWFQQKPNDARAWVENAPLTDQEYFLLTGRPKAH